MKKTGCVLWALLLICAILSGCFAQPHARADGIGRIPPEREAEWSGGQEELAAAQRHILALQRLEEQSGGFLCDTLHHDAADGKGRFSWNTDETISRPPHYYGQCITVTPFCFAYSPAYSTGGMPVTDLLSTQPDTLNPLVPAQHRPYAAQITQLYQDYMYFNDVAVSNIYAQRLGYSPDRHAAQDFRLNSIYVKNGQSYFPYKPDIAADNGHAIKDCIVMVLYPGTVHPVQFSAAMTRGFFCTAAGGEKAAAEKDVSAAFIQANAEKSFGSFTAVRRLFEEYSRDQLTACLIYLGAVAAAAVGLAALRRLIVYIRKKKNSGKHS